ncbi:MAG: hypothetical protein A2X49_09905 [Lentisphaerae bacterium GWF2_52_8]|nr:MAG: hypothetical protein A2X49_09905 [Lentisphaerae bacterium GWF2_52_8]
MTQEIANEAAGAACDYLLRIVGGAMSGSEFPIRKNSFTLGRSSEADIHVNDTLISRIHCRLTLEDGQWRLEDLGSTNGSWIVGQKVEKKVVLPLKTSARIGKTIFEMIDPYMGDKTGVFHTPGAPISYRIQPDNLAVLSPLDQKPKHGEMPMVKEENKRLAAVYKFQNIIASVLDEKELYSKIVNAVASVIPADAVYLLLFNLESGKFVPHVGRKSDGMIKEFNLREINDVIVQFVKENREAVLSIDDLSSKPVPGIQGLRTSTMCVPMLGKQQVNGMLYLVMSSASEVYTEDDLRLITVIGHAAGMALEHSKMMEFNLRNERLVATGTTAASLAHYVKNILAGLEGSLSLLRMAIDEKDFNLADESWNILSKNHHRLGNVVLDLLNLASEQKLKYEICDINQIVKDAFDLMKSQLALEGVTLMLDQATKDLPLYAEVDPKGVHRVLLNLLNNAEYAVVAKKKSIEDKDVGMIMLGACFNPNKDYVVVTITDDGVGLEPADTKKIFDLFITSKGTAGTGLGLAVCKRIVESHGGSITVTSEKGKGCTFAFSLPVAHNEMNTATRTIKRIY